MILVVREAKVVACLYIDNSTGYRTLTYKYPPPHTHTGLSHPGVWCQFWTTHDPDLNLCIQSGTFTESPFLCWFFTPYSCFPLLPMPVFLSSSLLWYTWPFPPSFALLCPPFSLTFSLTSALSGLCPLYLALCQQQLFSSSSVWTGRQTCSFSWKETSLSLLIRITYLSPRALSETRSKTHSNTCITVTATRQSCSVFVNAWNAYITKKWLVSLRNTQGRNLMLEDAKSVSCC